MAEVKGLGEGSEKGSSSNWSPTTSTNIGSPVEIEGFFNLLFAHFLSLFPIDAPETKERLLKLVQLITSSPDHSAAKYRMYVQQIIPLIQSDSVLAFQTSSMLSLAAPASVCT